MNEGCRECEETHKDRKHAVDEYKMRHSIVVTSKIVEKILHKRTLCMSGKGLKLELDHFPPFGRLDIRSLNSNIESEKEIERNKSCISDQLF